MDNLQNTSGDTLNKVQDNSSSSDNCDMEIADGSPLISIITITYNAESEIGPTLESLNRQTFRNFEHLVIDGASSDNTLAIVKEMSPDSIVISEPDKGLYDAMNKGLRAAKGEYVLFLNAGDSLHSPDILRRYAERRGANIIYGDTIIVDSERNFIKPRHLSAPKKLTFKSFSKGMLICHQAFMVRRSISPEYDLQYRFSADYEWTLKCLRSSDPTHNANIEAIAIDYLSDGLTDKNHKASLKERYKIMCRYYGTFPTVIRHIGFAVRNILRKFHLHS